MSETTKDNPTPASEAKALSSEAMAAMSSVFLSHEILRRRCDRIAIQLGRVVDELFQSKVEFDPANPCTGIVAIRSQLAEALAAKEESAEKAVDDEQVRWQKELDEQILRVYPDRDGSGCDSGDPLDMTATELCQAFRHLEEQRDNAIAFKTFVHGWLDKAGVPADPDPKHTKEHGCRIRGRLEWLGRERDAMREALEFYASSCNWRVRPYSTSPVSDDHGRRARRVLSPPAEPAKTEPAPQWTTDAEAITHGDGVDGGAPWEELVKTEPKTSFDQHLKAASKIVAKWPEWKRNLLGAALAALAALPLSPVQAQAPTAKETA